MKYPGVFISAMASAVALTAMHLAMTDAQCLSKDDDMTSIPIHHDISGMINFDISIFQNIYMHSSQAKNVFISPYSIWSSLLLVYLGSAGRTRAQMEEVLGITDKIATLKTWRVLEYMYKDRKGSGIGDTFVLANRVFIDHRISINPCFANILYDEVERIDMSRTFDASSRINQFVYERTFGKISNLVQASSLQRAVSVLANAAAFKGTWHVKFRTNNTTPQKFYSSPEDYTMVPMMSLQGSLKHGKSRELQAEVLELPYSDGYTSMYLLLPGLTTGADLGLADLIVRLTPERLRSTITNMWHRKVDVQLPRFKLQNAMKADLKETLSRMGLRDLFTNMANLTTLAPHGGLLVSDSIHQANIEVDEEGTEASAATIFIMTSRTRQPPEAATFKCNRPFLFVIYDNFTGNILFIGTYRNAMT